MPAITNINDELQLLTQLSNGNLNAFDTLYWHYQRAVYKNIFQLVKDQSIAEDILQEVFIKLWEKRETINTEVSLGGWLFVSSYNRSINYLKKRLRENAAADLIRIAFQSDDQEASIIKEMRLKELEDAIERLPAQKKKAFYLCKLKGCTYEEAAQIMKISKHTVKEYLSEALHSIKNQMIRPEGLGLVAIFLGLPDF